MSGAALDLRTRYEEVKVRYVFSTNLEPSKEGDRRRQAPYLARDSSSSAHVLPSPTDRA